MTDGGFIPPFAESTIADQKIRAKLISPEYPIQIYVDGSAAGLQVTDSTFETYYNQIIANVIAQAPVLAASVISHYKFPELPMVSDDNKKVFIYAVPKGDIKKTDWPKIVGGTPLTVYVGGGAVYGSQLSEQILIGIQKAEFGSLPVLFVLLLLSLGTFRAGLLPWFVALGGIFWTLAVLIITNQGFRVSGVSASITTIFGLGLAIDYSLFIVSRFADERARYPDVHVTLILKRTLQTSGRTVALSALTVCLALSGGLFFQEVLLNIT